MKIGIFDSGVGGLTVAKAIAQKFSQSHIVYFGDSIHLPYGNKSPQSVLSYSFKNVEFLKKKKCDLIVVACNTSTAIAMHQLKKENPTLPIFGVIAGGVLAAVQSSHQKKIGILGTLRTIKSSVYKTKILEKNPKAQVYEMASPLLVPLIEEGFQNKEIIIAIIKNYLGTMIKKIDTLILGCTHYPLIKKLIQQTYPQLNIIDSAKITANLIAENIKNLDFSQQNSSKRKIEIFTNDDNEIFRKISSKIFPQEKIFLTD